MCFYRRPEQEKANIALEDIKCYKILHRNSHHKTIISPFWSYEWKPGEPNTTEEMVIETSWANSLTNGFHSLRNISSALHYGELEGVNGPNQAIFECTIPKGSLYWDNNTQYLSNALTLNSDTPVREFHEKVEVITE